MNGLHIGIIHCYCHFRDKNIGILFIAPFIISSSIFIRLSKKQVVYIFQNWYLLNGNLLKVCQNAPLLFFTQKPRLSQAGALLLPKDFVSLSISSLL